MSNDKWIELDCERIKCQIKRIDDGSYWTLRTDSLAIRECYGVWWNYLKQSDNALLNKAPLAFFLASFERAYGASGNMYDDYKGAFSFPFAIKVFQRDTAIAYLLNVTSWRGSIEFNFRKIIPDNETRYDRIIVHKPFDDEFSETQMRIVCHFLMGFSKGFWNSTERHKDKLEKRYPEDSQCDFVKAIDSNNILFGYKDGHLFEMHFSDQDEYEQMKKELLIPYQQASHQKILRKTFFDD